jgi:hypothetical protein
MQILLNYFDKKWFRYQWHIKECPSVGFYFGDFDFFLQEAAPDIPETRTYSVNGQVQLSYPQIRILKHDYSGISDKMCKI